MTRAAPPRVCAARVCAAPSAQTVCTDAVILASLRRLDRSRAGMFAVGLVVALLLMCVPATSLARTVTLHGIVVHRSHRARTFVLADRAGNLVEVHSTRTPR